MKHAKLKTKFLDCSFQEKHSVAVLHYMYFEKEKLDMFNI